MLQVVAAAVDGAVLGALAADADGLAEGRVVQTDHLVLQEGQERVRGHVAAGRGCGGRLESFLEVSDMAEQYAYIYLVTTAILSQYAKQMPAYCLVTVVLNFMKKGIEKILRLRISYS